MLVVQGYCPICESAAEYRASGEWLRDQLYCQSCPGGSIPRERALALVLNEIRPNWRDLAIHESSPAERGISLKLSTYAPGYVGSQYLPNEPFGELVGPHRNEDLESLTFKDASFDITITLDVMEHVYRPDKVFKEVYRTLKPGGVYICTFPVLKAQVDAWERRFELSADGDRIDLKEPEFHINPVSEEGSIVTIDWGYNLHQQIAEWVPFDVRVYRFSDRTHGIMGEFTEVIVCRKSAEIPAPSRPTIPPGFDPAGYLRLNHDVATSGVPAEEHWLQYGRFEHRRWR